MASMIIMSVGLFYVVFFWFAAAQNKQRELHTASHVDPGTDRPMLSGKLGL